MRTDPSLPPADEAPDTTLDRVDQPDLLQETLEDTPAATGVLERRERRKRLFAWEEEELSVKGLYARNFEAVRLEHPELSPMECRTCALAKAMIPHWKIAEILGISERTVENHLRGARKKLGLARGTKIHQVLRSVL